MTPKTAYDTLAVPPNATPAEIEDNYNSLVARLKSQKSLFNPDDYVLKLDAINQAFEALATPGSRAAYDGQLARRSTSLAASMAHEETASLALRAEAISLRAEAIALRADAMSIHAQHDALGKRGASADGALSFMPLLKRAAMWLVSRHSPNDGLRSSSPRIAALQPLSMLEHGRAVCALHCTPMTSRNSAI